MYGGLLRFAASALSELNGRAQLRHDDVAGFAVSVKSISKRRPEPPARADIGAEHRVDLVFRRLDRADSRHRRQAQRQHGIERGQTSQRETPKTAQSTRFLCS